MKTYKVTIKGTGRPHRTVDTLHITGKELEKLAYTNDYDSEDHGDSHDSMISYLAETLSDSRSCWWCEECTTEEYENGSTVDWVRTIEKA